MGAFGREEDNASLGVKLVRIAHMHRMLTGGAFQYFGLTPGQPPVLHYLSEHDGCIQRELAEHHHHQAASISAILDSMEEAGLVERRRDETDKRVWRIYMTDKARKTNRTIERIFDGMDDTMTKGMSPEDRTKLLTMLDTVIQNLHQLEQMDLEEVEQYRKDILDEKTDPIH